MWMFTANGTLVLGDRLKQSYEGETDGEGLRHGHGVYTYANSVFKYEGEYVKGEKHGVNRQGISSSDPPKDHTVVAWIQGQVDTWFMRAVRQTREPHADRKLPMDVGKGRLMLNDGSYFEGTFQNDEVCVLTFCSENPNQTGCHYMQCAPADRWPWHSCLQ